VRFFKKLFNSPAGILAPSTHPCLLPPFLSHWANCSHV